MINLKKLLASAMALAMVTSVAPVKAANIDLDVCSTTFTNGVEKVMNVLEKAILAQVDDIEFVTPATKVDWQGSKVSEGNGKTITDILDDTISYNEDEMTLAEAFEKLVDCGNDGDYPVAEYLGGYDDTFTREDLKLDFVNKVNVLEYYIAEMTVRFGEEDAKYDFTPSTETKGGGVTSTPTDGVQLIGGSVKITDADAKKIYGKLTDEALTPYLGSVSEDAAYLYELLFNDLEEYVSEVFGDTYESALKTYLSDLLGKTVVTKDGVNVTVEDLIKGTTKAGLVKHSDYKVIANFIKAEKKTTTYKKLADADEVVDVIEALEAIAEDAQEVDEFIKPINNKKDATYRALYVTKAAWNGENKTTLAAYLIDAMKDVEEEATVAKREAAFEDLLNSITTDEMETVVAYVENITNEFYTVEKVERSTGTYNIKFTATELATYLTEAEAKVVKGLVELVLDGADNKSDETYYEVLEAKIDAIEDAVVAISTGIKDITVNNLNSKNAAKVVAANDALDVLKGQALTSAQTKVYNANRKNVEVLHNYMLYNGVVTVEPNGWVELDNGNWDYYVEGKAFTGWVAAGSNWYYVKNGHMLRNSWIAKDATGAVWYYVGNDGAMVSNTVVDGYTINANGEWVK